MLAVTPEHLSQAKELRDQGVPWLKIGTILGLSSIHRVRRILDPEYDERVRTHGRKQNDTFKAETAGQVFYGPVPEPETLAERDRVCNQWPVSLTAAFCGDPLPGRSALDKKAM